MTPKATKPRTKPSKSTDRPDKGGRPSKYLAKYCAEIIAKAKEGLTFQMIACDWGVHVDTLHEWSAKHPEFSEAKKLARQYQEVVFQRMYLSGMAGQLKRVASRTTTTRRDPNGQEVKEMKETFAPAAFGQAAAIFWAKAQFGYREDANGINEDDVEPVFD